MMMGPLAGAAWARARRAPHHRTRREAFLHRVVDDQRDLLHVQATSHEARGFQPRGVLLADAPVDALT